MSKTFRDIMSELPEADRNRIEKRGNQIHNTYLTLQELRKHKQLTQKQLAEILGVKQENISKLENRSDLLLSTLNSYVTAIGGNLKLVVEFPDKNNPLVLRLK